MKIRHNTLKLSAPCDLSYLHIVQSFVRETAKQFGFTGDDLNKIELAIEEGVANVMEHAFADEDEINTFDVICERIQMGMRIIIKEKGIPFDPRQLPRFAPVDDIEQVASSGMGVFLMRESMDEVAFLNLGPEGKETHLTKFLPAKNIEEYLTDAERKVEPRAQEIEDAPQAAGKIDYTVRRMRPEEAIEISRCAYKSHGYTFFDDHIYYPDRIIELNATDEMISAVAVTGDNQFMGHGALVYPEPGARIAELTFVFVNQEYRSQGCMGRLSQFLMDTPKRHALDGVYGYSVANHVFTQRGTLRMGFNDCGILLATSPITWRFKGIVDENDQRISVVLSFRYVEVPPPRTLFAPPQHREMIVKLYENIRAGHVCAAPETDAPSFAGNESVIETSIFASESCGEIWVKRYGARAVREIRGILRDLCLKQIAAINLFLSLEDPATSFITEELEKLGFFFAGILPETGIGDVLILQYLNNVAFDYGKVQAYSDMAKEILVYIQARDPNASL
ncbi:MAG: ATP-binding protein [Deltaproteobacteria bacterium]|nr:ATP-binding protein [Deltaproteobacteria bacterium]